MKISFLRTRARSYARTSSESEKQHGRERTQFSAQLKRKNTSELESAWRIVRLGYCGKLKPIIVNVV